MRKPKILVFDYGQTLINEKSFDATEGTKAIINSYTNIDNDEIIKQIDELAKQVSLDIKKYKNQEYPNNFLEIHHHQIQNYLYEYFEIDIKANKYELEKTFWEASTPSIKTKHITTMLNYLIENDIKIAVASNISFSRETMSCCLKKYFPMVNFDFIMTSADFIFRKPHYRFFDMVVRKADLLFKDEINREDIWYCGDKPVWDVDGSSAAGLTAIWYTGALEIDNIIKPTCDNIEIKDWNELIDILKNCD